MIQKIGIFCGSQNGKNPTYKQQVTKFMQQLCQYNIEIIYGGANLGLMQTVAEVALEHNIKVTGIMPKKLIDLEAHPNLTQMHIVEGMVERKVRLADLSDAFITLPGGIGSLDELFEMITLTHLKYQNKPSALLNIHNYFDQLIAFMQHAQQEGFLRSPLNELMTVVNNADELAKAWQLN